MSDLIRLKPETVRPLSDVETTVPQKTEEEAPLLAAVREPVRYHLWIVLVCAALVVVLILLIGESIRYMHALIQIHMALAYTYAAAVVVLVLGVAWLVVRSMWDYARIGQMGCAEDMRVEIARDPDSDDVRAYVIRLAARYERHPDPVVRAGVMALRERMRVTEMGSDMLAELRAGVLIHLDAKVEEIIKTTALQTALGTAISPVAFVDAALVMWRNVAMVRRIAEVYGNRPNVAGTWRLMGCVMATVAFAGVADLAADALHQIIGSGLAGRLSGAVAQGLSTGFLTVRVGMATRIVCRPLPLDENEAKNSFRLFAESLWKALRGKLGEE